MKKEITSQAVAQQVALAVEYLLEWLETNSKISVIQNEQKQYEQKMEVVESMTLLTAEEAAKKLNISKSMMYRIMQRNEIPTVRIGRSRRVRVEDLEEFETASIQYSCFSSK